MSRKTNNLSMKTIKKQMTDELRMLADHKLGSAKMILKEGTWFEARADSHDYEVTDAWRKSRRPKTKECYYNAQSFCVDHAEGRYFEGNAFGSITCVPHAWVVMPDGKVIDFTWEALDRKMGGDTSDALYLGVEVPTPEFCKVIAQTGMWGPVLPWLGIETKGLMRKAKNGRRKVA